MGVNCSANGIVGIHDILRNVKWKVYGCKLVKIGCYLGIFSRLVCMRYHCTLHQTLYAWLMRGVWYWCGLESLIIGSYVYHSDVIAGTHAMLII